MVLCLYSSDKQKMIPKELFTSKTKLAEQKAEGVRKITSEEKAVSMAKYAEQEAERVRK